MMQSVLHPGGPEADRILTLALIMFAGALVILALVCAAAALAVRGPQRYRGFLSSQRFVVGAGIVLPTISLTVLLIFGLLLMRETLAQGDEAASLRIEVSGERWWWRVTYVSGDGRRVNEANEVRLPVGRTVDIALTSPDVIHSFWVPALAGKLDMIPGRTNRMKVTVDRAGVFRGQCAEYCGGPHALMAFDVVAMPPDDFDSWLGGASAPATGETAARGQRLFVASGCGGCHAIRGTEANGEIGPDLSRVGGRRVIAAGTLPMNESTLAAFITDSSRFKPENMMPPFKVFSDEEIMTLARYLVELK